VSGENEQYPVPDGDGSVCETSARQNRPTVTPMKAIRAKCRDCCGGYHDGREDCLVRKCPLYTYMKYREAEPDLSWAETGKAKLTGAKRAAFVERMRAAKRGESC
jgi:hypothetical protein